MFRYLLSCITFSTYTTVAQGSYRFAFVAAAATYGIVVYKGYVARGRLGGSIPNDIIKLAGDENVQYLGRAHKHTHIYFTKCRNVEMLKY